MLIVRNVRSYTVEAVSNRHARQDIEDCMSHSKHHSKSPGMISEREGWGCCVIRRKRNLNAGVEARANAHLHILWVN